MIQIGTILGGRYEILEHIGSGGMADVYKAKCHKLNRYVAVKVLRREYNDDEAFVKKFIAEAQSTAGLAHPNIVNIYDAENEQGIHYIVMELAEGMTLKRYIRRYGRLSARETVDFAIQIASGIQAAHEHHIIHRDIKPQNILVSDSGKIKVTDFGIAKAATGDTISSNTMGSVRYLSPEQARGGYSDERSDIYSLGITIYEMATGRVPFDGENTVAIALMHLKDDITPPRCYFPDIPASLENIIMKCTMKRPENRYQSAAELLKDLQQVFLSPDGNYVYLNPGAEVDDSPTRIRTKEEMEAIKQSLEKDVETLPANRDRMQKKRTEGKREKEIAMDDGEEDYEDDASMSPRLEKMILMITILSGILLACVIFYFIGTSTNLLRPSGNATTESREVTEKSTEDTGATDAVYVEMPDLLGLTKTKASEELAALSLTTDFSYQKGADNNDDTLIVVEQEYDQGDSIAAGTAVKLTLGIDESATTQAKRVEVPALVNDTEEQAEKKLKALGLDVQKAYATSDTVKEGYVIKQSPKGGSIVDRGFAVTITISQGVAQVRVPSLYGMSQSAAERELNKVGLYLGSVTSDYSGSVGIGDVIEQEIESGTSVDKGTKVSIVISLGEQETFRYEGDITITESPFDDTVTVGKIELVLKQNGSTKNIYTKSDATAETFPLDVAFEGSAEGEATVTMYVDGQEYGEYDVMLAAIAD